MRKAANQPSNEAEHNQARMDALRNQGRRSYQVVSHAVARDAHNSYNKFPSDFAKDVASKVSDITNKATGHGDFFKKMAGHHGQMADYHDKKSKENKPWGQIHQRAADRHRDAAQLANQLSGKTEFDRGDAQEYKLMGRLAHSESAIAHKKHPLDKSFQIMDEIMGMSKSLPQKLMKLGKQKKQVLAHGAHHTPPKEYRETGATEGKDYADPESKKYPIHTEHNTRAAISYFSKPKNANVYSPKQQQTIWGRIKRAAKKYGIQISKQSGPPSVETKKSLDMIESMIKSAKLVRLMPDPNKKSLEKGTEAESKAYLGTLKPGQGFTGSGAAPRGYQPGSPEKVKQRISDKDAKKMGWTTAKMEEDMGKKSMEKALKASDLPRIPRAIRMKMEEMSPYHRAMMRISQANSRYQDKYAGPLQGELLEDSTVSKALELDNVCLTCGRTYLAKSDSGCPTCTTTKAMYCNKCGNPLQKSHDGSLMCSLCG